MSHVMMSQMPAHGNAAGSKVGNASMPAFMGGDYTPGMAGGNVSQMMCHFPQPPPKRCYCHPAAFSSLDGRTHQRLLDAYGASRPCQNYY